MEQKVLEHAELEKRLQPNGYSTLGFLGKNENLREIIEQDTEILRRHNLTHKQVADAIQTILDDVRDQQKKTVYPDSYIKKYTDYPDLHQPETNPSFSLINLPTTDVGWFVGKFQVFMIQYRGFQECPWNCGKEVWGSFDFMILNRENGESFTGPQMIVHLIREHHFFEGKETPYRSAPEKIIRTLELNKR